MYFQGDAQDEMIKATYPSLFFLNYYNRDSSEEYARFIDNVRNGSAEHFQYYYAAEEEVRKTG